MQKVKHIEPKVLKKNELDRCSAHFVPILMPSKATWASGHSSETIDVQKVKKKSAKAVQREGSGAKRHKRPGAFRLVLMLTLWISTCALGVLMLRITPQQLAGGFAIAFNISFNCLKIIEYHLIYSNIIYLVCIYGQKCCMLLYGCMTSSNRQVLRYHRYHRYHRYQVAHLSDHPQKSRRVPGENFTMSCLLLQKLPLEPPLEGQIESCSCMQLQHLQGFRISHLETPIMTHYVVSRCESVLW